MGTVALASSRMHHRKFGFHPTPMLGDPCPSLLFWRSLAELTPCNRDQSNLNRHCRPTCRLLWTGLYAAQPGIQVRSQEIESYLCFPASIMIIYFVLNCDRKETCVERILARMT